MFEVYFRRSEVLHSVFTGVIVRNPLSVLFRFEHEDLVDKKGRDLYIQIEYPGLPEDHAKLSTECRNCPIFQQAIRVPEEVRVISGSASRACLLQRSFIISIENHEKSIIFIGRS